MKITREMSMETLCGVTGTHNTVRTPLDTSPKPYSPNGGQPLGRFPPLAEMAEYTPGEQAAKGNPAVERQRHLADGHPNNCPAVTDAQ